MGILGLSLPPAAPCPGGAWEANTRVPTHKRCDLAPLEAAAGPCVPQQRADTVAGTPEVSLTDVFPKQAVVSSGTCHRRPAAVSWMCRCRGGANRETWSCAVVQNASPACTEARADVPRGGLVVPGPLSSMHRVERCGPSQQPTRILNLMC